MQYRIRRNTLMIKPIYVRIILCFLIISLCLSYESGLSGLPQQIDSNQPNEVNVGKENPFSQFQPSVSQRVSETTGIEEYAPGLFVETVTLKFLDAKNLKPAIAGMSSQDGRISIDGGSNSLIICDTKENLEKILAQIRKADKTPEQIMIEVVILDVQLGDDTEIGVDWERLFETNHDETYKQTLIPTMSTTGGDFGITKSDIKGTLHLLQEIRNVEILASPRILVASGKEALIQTVEEIPYVELSQTSGGGAGTLAISSTGFKEAGITLRVKVTVADEQKILMTIESEQSVNTGVAGVGDTTVPIVNKRKASTTLVMEDGQVLIMGGLRKKEIRITKNQIPLLGDIPLLGGLFAYDKREAKNTELMVLISPHVNKGEPIPDDAMKKFKELGKKPLLSLPSDWRDPFRNIGKQPQKK
jgi:type II secretory pathway component GspD/PulD (secretin)